MVSEGSIAHSPIPGRVPPVPGSTTTNSEKKVRSYSFSDDDSTLKQIHCYLQSSNTSSPKTPLVCHRPCFVKKYIELFRSELRKLHGWPFHLPRSQLDRPMAEKKSE